MASFGQGPPGVYAILFHLMEYARPGITLCSSWQNLLLIETKIPSWSGQLRGQKGKESPPNKCQQLTAATIRQKAEGLGC